MRVALLVALLGVVAPTSLRADELGAAARELSTSTDFRVRVSAALVLGHQPQPGAREALEHALSDAHPAVRVAAAEALGSLGDPAAAPALDQRLTNETSQNVKAQIRASVSRLRAAGALADGDGAQGARCFIVLGTMRNTSGVRGDEITQMILSATRARARALRGVIFSSSDAQASRRVASRRLPVITIDGSVVQLVESRADGGVQIRARVEFTMRRDQTLKGALTGAATTFGPGPFISDDVRRRLQDEAVDGAVQSALRGAEEGILVAAR